MGRSRLAALDGRLVVLRVAARSAVSDGPDLRLVDAPKCGAEDVTNQGEVFRCYLKPGHEGDHFMEGPLPAERPTREEMLEAVPVDVEIDESVDLEAADPAYSDTSSRRLCISTRRAGGRCTAPPHLDGLLCGIHAGTLDPRKAALASAAARRKGTETQQETARLAQLGTRGVIAETLAAEASQVRATVRTLLRNAAQGDRQCALALIPYMNQGLGMPTERVRVEQEGVSALDDLSQSELAERVAQLRAKRAGRDQTAADSLEAAQQT